MRGEKNKIQPKTVDPLREAGHCPEATAVGSKLHSDPNLDSLDTEKSVNDSVTTVDDRRTEHCPVVSGSSSKSECSDTETDLFDNDSTKNRLNNSEHQKHSTVYATPVLGKHYEKTKFECTDEINTSKVPASLLHLIKGVNVNADPFNKSDFKPPSWLDMKNFELGRKFATKCFFGIAYAEVLSLMMLFSFKGALDPLIFTNKSSSPFTAFQRYLSTVVRVRSWYHDDVWDPTSIAGKNMAVVRTLHSRVKERMNNHDPEQVAHQIKLNPGEICCPFLSRIHEDCGTSVPAPLVGQCPYESISKPLYVNQFDMSITQFGFVGLMVLFPEKFGAYDATEKELDSFVHLWAGLGYLLGIEDRFNFCIGGLNECRRMSYDVINYWVKPNLREVRPEWEHMSRCVVEGIRYYHPANSFEAAISYLFWVLDIPTSRLSIVIPWWRRILFYLQKFGLCVLMRLPGQRALYNWRLHQRIDRASQASPAWLERLKTRARDFVKRHAAASQTPRGLSSFQVYDYM